MSDFFLMSSYFFSGKFGQDPGTQFRAKKDKPKTSAYEGKHLVVTEVWQDVATFDFPWFGIQLHQAR